MIDHRLLIVDDEVGICEFVGEVAVDCGFEVASASSHAEFLEVYHSFKPALIVLDLVMPDGDGVELLRLLAEEKSRAGILLLSGFDARVRNTAARMGSELGLRMLASLQKPIEIGALEEILRGHVTVGQGLARTDLERALEQQELFLVFQPKVELRSRAVCGAEALVRWKHPDLGLVAPDQFVRLYETEGLVDHLTDLVLEQACRQVRDWRETGLDLLVSMNLSPLQLADLTLPDRFARRVRELGVGPSSLILEVTETGAMADPVRAADILARLRLKGFQLSLDDFGTGYSSLRWLHRLPFSELKVDRSFVSELGTSEEAHIIVRSIIDLAHNLKLEVCAEGIETQLAWDALSELGCEQAQGYLMSRPLPGAEIPSWIARWKRA